MDRLPRCEEAQVGESAIHTVDGLSRPMVVVPAARHYRIVVFVLGITQERGIILEGPKAGGGRLRDLLQRLQCARQHIWEYPPGCGRLMRQLFPLRARKQRLNDLQALFVERISPTK